MLSTQGLQDYWPQDISVLAFWHKHSPCPGLEMPYLRADTPCQHTSIASEWDKAKITLMLHIETPLTLAIIILTSNWQPNGRNLIWFGLSQKFSLNWRSLRLCGLSFHSTRQTSLSWNLLSRPLNQNLAHIWLKSAIWPKWFKHETSNDTILNINIYFHVYSRCNTIKANACENYKPLLSLIIITIQSSLFMLHLYLSLLLNNPWHLFCWHVLINTHTFPKRAKKKTQSRVFCVKPIKTLSLGSWYPGRQKWLLWKQIRHSISGRVRT